jgi:hypothetical protein
MQEQKPISEPGTPLAQRFTLQELPGRLNKFLIVPAAKIGVQMDAQGKARLFQPGRWKVVSFWQRIWGKGQDGVFGVLPAVPFLAEVRLQHLLSGDAVLMESLIFLTVKVKDPLAFFQQVVLPQRVLPASPIDLTQTPFSEAVAQITRQYSADDLSGPYLQERLTLQTTSWLDMALEVLGLQSEGIQIFSFWRADERLTIAQQALQLEEKEQELKLERQMMGLENQATLEDFSRQLQGTLGGGVAVLGEAPAGQKAEEGSTISSAQSLLQAWLKGLKDSQKSSVPWRFFNLLRKKEKESAPDPLELRQVRSWMIGRGAWMIFIFLLALTLSAVVVWLSGGRTFEGKADLLVVIWAPTLGLLMESLIAIMKKREAISAAFWTKAGITHLDELSGKDRHKVDELVRRQCSQDLGQVYSLLQETRSTIYQQGNTDLALKIKDLERKVEAVKGEILNPAFGPPAYLGDAHFSTSDWQSMLDDEENLLLMSAFLAEMAYHFQQQALKKQGDLAAALLDLEERLNAFKHAFSARGRALRFAIGETAQLP